LSHPTFPQLRKLIGVANYQFGKNVGSVLFNRDVKVTCSRRTGRIRHVFRKNQLIATLRPKDGYLALTIVGAKLILSRTKDPPNLVIVQNDVSEFIRTGGDVFAKHIVGADRCLRPAEEVIVVDENKHLLAVGRAFLSGNDMQYFKRGVAVKVRRGVDDSRRERIQHTQSAA
jgi:predicted RNA-binding protein (TIGR00451 family)